RFGRLRFVLLLDRFRPLAHPLIVALALHSRVEHLQSSAAGIDLVVMSEIGEAFEDAEQLLVPGASPDLHIAGAALRTEWPEPRELVAALGSRHHGEGTECAHQVKRLALAGLPRILAEPDADPVAVLRGGIEQQSVDIARVGPPAHHIQEPVAAALVAAELDADRPIGVVELGLFRGGEIPVTNHVEVRRDLVDNGAPLPFEVETGSRPDLPIAAQQPLALEQWQRKQPSEILRVDPQQYWVVEYRRRDEGHADRPRWVDAGRKIPRLRQVLHQFFRS